MTLQTISFKAPPPRGRSGNPLPEGSDLPRVRGNKRMSTKKMLDLLDSAIDILSESTCSFWACRGPNYVRNMMTCSKCQAVREIARVKASLELRSKRPKLPVSPRRWSGHRGYLESDREFLERNAETAISLLQRELGRRVK